MKDLAKYAIELFFEQGKKLSDIVSEAITNEIKPVVGGRPILYIDKWDTNRVNASFDKYINDYYEYDKSNDNLCIDSESTLKDLTIKNFLKSKHIPFELSDGSIGSCNIFIENASKYFTIQEIQLLDDESIYEIKPIAAHSKLFVEVSPNPAELENTYSYNADFRIGPLKFNGHYYIDHEHVGLYSIELSDVGYKYEELIELLERIGIKDWTTNGDHEGVDSLYIDKIEKYPNIIVNKKVNEIKDLVPGGLAKGKTLQDIAKKHKVSLNSLESQLQKGIKVEMEHTTDKAVAHEIATDHLFEDPKYYDKLAKIEEIQVSQHYDQIDQALEQINNSNISTKYVSSFDNTPIGKYLPLLNKSNKPFFISSKIQSTDKPIKVYIGFSKMDKTTTGGMVRSQNSNDALILINWDLYNAEYAVLKSIIIHELTHALDPALSDKKLKKDVGSDTLGKEYWQIQPEKMARVNELALVISDELKTLENNLGNISPTEKQQILSKTKKLILQYIIWLLNNTGNGNIKDFLNTHDVSKADIMAIKGINFEVRQWFIDNHTSFSKNNPKYPKDIMKLLLKKVGIKDIINEIKPVPSSIRPTLIVGKEDRDMPGLSASSFDREPLKLVNWVYDTEKDPYLMGLTYDNSNKLKIKKYLTDNSINYVEYEGDDSIYITHPEKYFNIKNSNNLQEAKLHNKEIELPEIIEQINQYAIDNGYKIEPKPTLNIIDGDEKNADNLLGKTAHYNPNNKSITLYTFGRHPKDVTRSYCHELIHHIQNLEDRIKDINTTNINEDEYLKEIEREAYEKGNILMRSWENSIKQNS